jgi:hypothetical protein
MHGPSPQKILCHPSPSPTHGSKIYRHPDFYIRILSQRDPVKIAAIIPIRINYSNVFSVLSLFFSPSSHLRAVNYTRTKRSPIKLSVFISATFSFLFSAYSPIHVMTGGSLIYYSYFLPFFCYPCE